MLDLNSIATQFKNRVPAATSWSLRLVETQSQSITVRQDILQPFETDISRGAFISVIDDKAVGYSATPNLETDGLLRAFDEAKKWAKTSRRHAIPGFEKTAFTDHTGHYESAVTKPWESLGLADKIEMLIKANKSLKIDSRIVDWIAYLRYKTSRVLIVTGNGGQISQTFHYISPGVFAVANQGSQTQTRSGAGAGTARQGGLEHLELLGFPDQGPQVAQDAIELLQAPECPSGNLSMILEPDQMMLQIHESIGHPLELDRILGDERNYAGTSFVTMEMFGNYQYGSKLLNVTFDPNRVEQMASYGYDDEGTHAEKTYIIKEGILKCPLGGLDSQKRAHLPGVANSRASGWNRPPIDRMANLNVEPGQSSLQDMISSVENGVLMKTNRSWSIDDSRNKFQFGCELGQLIQDGELKSIVRNPNYRGISASFWRNLTKVGDKNSFEILGTPFCGKGEPNQLIHVGHASPACLFENVDVFGGAK